MVTQYGTTQEIFEERSRWGPALMWVAPPRNADGTVTLAREGNDPDYLLPPFAPRPASGGFFLGYDIDGISEKPLVTYEEVPIVGSTIPRTVRVKEESVTVSAKLIFNNDPTVRPFFLPTGLTNATGYTYGGLTTVNQWPLLVVIYNFNNPELIECHYYHNGYFEPTETIHGKLFSPINMVYHGLAGTQYESDTGNTCLLPAGQRLVKTWYVYVDFDGTNILVDSRGNEIIADPYPAVSYVTHTTTLPYFI